MGLEQIPFSKEAGKKLSELDLDDKEELVLLCRLRAHQRKMSEVTATLVNSCYAELINKTDTP